MRTACETGRAEPHPSPKATEHRDRREDHLPAAALPLRAAARSRCTWRRYHDIDDQPVGGVAHPQAARPEPAAGVAALQDATNAAGSVTRSSCPATASRSTSSSSNRSAAPARSTTSSPPSMTAPASGSCASTEATTRRPRSSSSTTSSSGSRSVSSASRPTTAPSSKAPSTGTSSTAASATSTSSRETPRLNGKVERSHRIDAEEFYRLLAGVVIDDSKLFTEKLQEWEDYYNFHRPHGGLDGQTPYERLRQKTKTPAA